MNTSRLLKTVIQHPAWAVTEGTARLRRSFAPKHGARISNIGPIQFEFDFELTPFMRAMYAGAYETDIVALIRKLLRPGSSFVDVGSNIGYLSSVAAGCVGPTGTILSFEPAPKYFSRLSSLRDRNPGYDWHVYNIGIGAEAATAELVMSSRNIGWNSLVPGQIHEDLVDERVSITIDRLDNCLQRAGVTRVNLLKIDVEGYEANVLLGAESCLEAGIVDNLLVEVLPGQYSALGLDFVQVMNMVTSHGYQALNTRKPYQVVQWSEVTDGENIWFRRTGNP